MHAAVRRRGHYHKLDLARLGAAFAANAAAVAYNSAFRHVKSEAEKLAAQDRALERHVMGRVSDYAGAVLGYREAVWKRWQYLLTEYFASANADEMWQWCLNRRGRGDGYIADVIDRIEQESDRAQLNAKVADSIDSQLPKRPELFSLRRVRAKNFRGIDDGGHDLGNTTVFIGDNGQGKTCWLEAMAAAVGAFLPGVGAGSAPALAETDVREVVRFMGGLPDRQRQIPMQIEVDAVVEGQPLTWSRQVDKLPVAEVVNADDALQTKARKAGEEIRAHGLRQLPVLAYYGTQRLWPADILPKSDVGQNRLDGLQFITTTHSPFIVQSLEPGQLVNLNEQVKDAPYANESPEDNQANWIPSCFASSEVTPSAADTLSIFSVPPARWYASRMI